MRKLKSKDFRSTSFLIKQPEAVRYEGNTMIIPVLQEITVIEKRILSEEIHITKAS